MTHKITSLTVQARDPNRVNVRLDGKYRFSLDIFQVTELRLKVGVELDDDGLAELEEKSQFGKLYAQTLEYCLVRPRSIQEVRDYLWRKTLNRKVKKRNGEVVDRKGVSSQIAEQVLERLIDKKYLDDRKFANYWVENRNIQKGSSRKKLQYELRQKGVEADVIEDVIQNSPRDEKSELLKIVTKKRSKYPDEQKLIAYLLRQGFNYEDVREAMTGLSQGG